MIEGSKGNRSEGAVHTDQIGKVFRAIITHGVSLRECLACRELFSRETSREHSEVPCYLDEANYRDLMKGAEIIEKTHTEFSHQHGCEVEGHYYECTEDCVCICGLPMSGNDHSDCPVELRACPEHNKPETVSSEEQTEIEPLCEQQNAAPPHCECGCSEIDLNGVVGWCLHCDHVYANYAPEIEDRHFANHCPNAPETVKGSSEGETGQVRNVSFLRDEVGNLF